MRRSSFAAAVLLLTSCAAGQPPSSQPQQAAALRDVDWRAAETVTVRLEDYRFVPDRLNFRHGAPYRLRLENRSTHQHEFTAPAFFGAIAVRNADVVSTARPEIVVDPGQAKELYFVPATPGRYELSCADHDFAGMVGEIAVD
jgi:uncharacterized cupredoxin-like copper-binding protein